MCACLSAQTLDAHRRRATATACWYDSPLARGRHRELITRIPYIRNLTPLLPNPGERAWERSLRFDTARS
jgi:hypothetical protein